jgi:hypothetical protein
VATNGCKGLPQQEFPGSIAFPGMWGGGNATNPCPFVNQALKSGAEGDRTPNLSIANAALSQLSYGPARTTP